MSATISAPRFRSTSRLVQWVRRNRPQCRLAPESERCFFRASEPPAKVSSNLVRYSDQVGELGPELEALLDQKDVLGYLRHLSRKGVEPKEHLLDRLEVGGLVSLSGLSGRLPERYENRIQDSSWTTSYSEQVGPLDPSMEDRILDPEHIMRYSKVLDRHGRKLPESMLRRMVGHDKHFMPLYGHLGVRLPSYLEESISDPEVAYRYARGVLHGRLPESVEICLAKKPHWAVQYAFDIIRGFSSPRLPDFLHNAMVMSVGENEQEVRRYILEVERTSKKPEGAGA